jgi:phage tail-like protein
MPDETNTEATIFLANLPAIYQEEETPAKPLRRFLSAFEQVLLGDGDEPKASEKRRGKREASRRHIEGLGEKVAHLYELFDPRETPERFLPWLASWAALSIRANLSVPKQRKLIANLIPLYRIRGTRAYMERLLELCVDAGTSVSEDEIPSFQIGVHSTLGSDAYIGGGPPHFFQVTMLASEMGALEVQAQRQIAYEVIELAKPAHTVYDFVVKSPQLQVGVHSTVGVDTVLGSAAAQLP